MAAAAAAAATANSEDEVVLTAMACCILFSFLGMAASLKSLLDSMSEESLLLEP